MHHNNAMLSERTWKETWSGSNKTFIIFPVPRVLFDGWSGADYNALFSGEDSMEDCVDAILKFIKVSTICDYTCVVITRVLWLHACCDYTHVVITRVLWLHACCDYTRVRVLWLHACCDYTRVVITRVLWLHVCCDYTRVEFKVEKLKILHAKISFIYIQRSRFVENNTKKLATCFFSISINLLVKCWNWGNVGIGA
jgi:hypothetical protein